MISQWEFYQLKYGLAWNQLSRRGTPGLLKINGLPFSVKKTTFGRPEATQGSFRRPGLREAICGQEDTTVWCYQWPKQFKNH